MKKNSIEQAFTRSADTYKDNADVQRLVANRIIYILKKEIQETPKAILEIGAGSGLLTELLVEFYEKDTLSINDLSYELLLFVAEDLGLNISNLMTGDIETMNLPKEQFDLIVSSSVFQWLSDPKKTIARIADSLQTSGLLIFSTFGELNYNELYQSIDHNSFKYLNLSDWKMILEEHFEIVSTEQSEQIMYFDTFLDILRHMQSTGVNGVSDGKVWTPARVKEIDKIYREQFEFCKKLPLTYHPMIFVCKKK